MKKTTTLSESSNTSMTRPPVQSSFKSSIGDWFGATVGARQGCLLSAIFFSIFLERLMTDALKDHIDTINIGGRTVTSFRIADDINGLAGEEEKWAKLIEHLFKASTAYDMEISAKNKLMTNNTSDINTEININGQRLETVTSFKYLGSVVTYKNSKPEILSRITHTTAALTWL